MKLKKDVIAPSFCFALENRMLHEQRKAGKYRFCFTRYNNLYFESVFIILTKSYFPTQTKDSNKIILKQKNNL